METVTAAQILDGGGGGEYFMCQILSPLNGLFLARSDFDKARGGTLPVPTSDESCHRPRFSRHRSVLGTVHGGWRYVVLAWWWSTLLERFALRRQ